MSLSPTAQPGDSVVALDADRANGDLSTLEVIEQFVAGLAALPATPAPATPAAGASA